MDAIGGIFMAIGEGIVELLAIAWEAIHGDRSRVTKWVIVAYLVILSLAIFGVFMILRTGI